MKFFAGGGPHSSKGYLPAFAYSSIRVKIGIQRIASSLTDEGFHPSQVVQVHDESGRRLEV